MPSSYAALNDRTNVSRIYVELKRLLRAELNAAPLVRRISCIEN